MAGTAFLVGRVPTLRNFVVKVSTTGIEAELINDGSVQETLEKWLTSSATYPLVQAWFSVNLEKVDPDGSRIVAALARRCPMVSEKVGINAYQERIARCDADPILSRLRELSEDRVAPFQRRAMKVRIGTPKKDPPHGVAYTCYGGRLEHKRIRLLIPEIPRALEVQVRGGFPCDPGKTFPDLHVNGKQARSLLGRPTREIEEVFALII